MISKAPYFAKAKEKPNSLSIGRPEEVDFQQIRKDFQRLEEEHEQHIFLRTLKYQTLRTVVTRPFTKRCIHLPIVLCLNGNMDRNMAFSEKTISQAASYTHIIRNIVKRSDQNL